MKNIIALEEGIQFLAAIIVLYLLPVSMSWWWWVLLFFSPDVSMIGYAAGNKTGAIVYNIFHHKGIAAICIIAGLLLPETRLQLAGIILFAHIAFDRMLGYGLKTFQSFHHTHLGVIKN